MARKEIEVVLHGGPSDGKTIVVTTDTDEYYDPDATGGTYVRDASGVFRWEES